ncbi:UNVERIFIED_CONTAM: hypothetical protein HDU68_010868 [Siphonaria sp. JEL0065]|nr:hypothetical protein HDU68_010868 [Siphonaria sp. JEL0065]
MLVLQRDVTGVPAYRNTIPPEIYKRPPRPQFTAGTLAKEEEDDDDESKKSRKTVDPSSAADVLTILSQMILVASAAAFLFSCAYPEGASEILEKYKQKITERRHKNMLEFMSTDRDYIVGDMKSFFGSNTTTSNNNAFKKSLMFADQIYHQEVAEDARKMLFQAPILRFGIVTGPSGSGKTRLMRSLAHEQPYYGAKSIVDELGEEIGYDFDDWTERMLQGVLFKTGLTVFSSNCDKLSFLLDEFEETSWKLKFDKENGQTGKRPLLVLDDLDSLDFNDEEVVKTVRMLFNAANKFAREDTALIVFTLSDILLNELCTRGIVRSDIMTAAQVYRVGDLSDSEATRFLEDRIGSVAATSTSASTLSSADLKQSIDRIKAVMGTKIFDLMRVSEELVKKDSDNVEQVLERELRAAEDAVAHTLALVGDEIGESKVASVLKYIDQLSTINAKEEEYRHKHQVRENGWNFSDFEGRGGRVWEEARQKGLNHAWKVLRDNEVLGSDGLFNSDLMRNGYRQYRKLPPLIFSSGQQKKKWSWF